MTSGIERPSPALQSRIVRQAYAEASLFFVQTAARVPVDAWEHPGLGEWSIRSLVGHTSRSLLTVENYLDSVAQGTEIADPTDYFHRALAQAGDAAAITERGRLAGLALGTDPAGAVRALRDRVVARVEQTPDDALVGTPWGGMALLDYLRTRVFELTIHTLDLAAAIRETVSPPETTARITFELIGDLARLRGVEGILLLAATGRRPLPTGYTVL